MAVTTTLEIVGIKEALAELNTFDKKFRRGVTIEYKNIVQPMVIDARNLVPVRPPMSGFYRAWTPRGQAENWGGSVLPWTGRESSFIKPFVSGKRPKTFGSYTRDLTTFGIKWTSRSAVLFDQAGNSATPRGAQMVANLGARYGSPSRAMWRAYTQAGPDVQYELQQLVEKIMAQVGRNIRIQ